MCGSSWASASGATILREAVYHAAHAMHALTLHAPFDIRHESLADPRIEDGRDVVVEVEVTAICGSDLHPYRGREVGFDPGMIIGHEFLGRVVEVGAEVENWAAGDRVIAPFTTSCGQCFYCRRGLTCRCTRGQFFGWVAGGQGLHGAQAERVRVPLADASLVAVPAAVGSGRESAAEAALFAGDILATGYFCAEKAGVGPGVVAVVLGCGPVGLMAVIACHELGAAQVLAIDSVAERLELARGFGADPVDLSRGTDHVVAQVRRHTDGRGGDAVLEAVGLPEASALAFDVVRPGGAIAAVGVHTEPHFAFSPGQAYDKNLTYSAGRCPARAYMDRLLDLAIARSEDLAAIISHRLPLSEGPEAYRIFDQKVQGCTKVLLYPDE